MITVPIIAMQLMFHDLFLTDGAFPLFTIAMLVQVFPSMFSTLWREMKPVDEFFIEGWHRFISLEFNYMFRTDPRHVFGHTLSPG